MFDFNRIPFFRILIPFVLGIWISLEFNLKPVGSFVILGALVIASVLFFMKKQVRITQFLFLIITDCILFILGVNLSFHSQLIHQEEYYSNKVKNDTLFCLAEVNDVPVQKSKTTKVNFKLLKVKSETNYISVKGNVIAYLQNSIQNETIKPGKVYLLHGVLQEVPRPMNPYAFNYKYYLSVRNIYHTLYLDSNSFKEVNVGLPFSISRIGIQIKSKIVSRLKEIGLSKNAYSICSALITGFDDDIDKSVIEDFSHSGTLHVLSVSGLHVGLIYLVLNFCLSIIDRKKKYKISQLIFITICLWFFAFITGFSAPVLRSVIMFNLLGFGNLFFRNKSFNQINILFASAFMLLLYDPLFLKDVGFLLSYSALFGILYFYPKLEKLYDPKNKISKYIWQSAIVSVSATISTLPITLLVFHQFPIWFAFANLIIVPATFVLLFLSFLALFKITFITWIINQLILLLTSFIKIFNSDAYAFVDYVDFNWIDSFLLILILGSFTALIMKRNYPSVLTFFTILISWQLYSIGNSYESKSKSELVIYQIPKSEQISIKNQTQLQLNKRDNSNFLMQVKPNLVSYNYPKINYQDFNYLQTDKIGLLILNQKNKAPDVLPTNITHLLISNNAIPDNSFFDQLKLKTVIADGSNSSYSINKLKEICSKYEIQFYPTKSKGAFIFPL